MRGFNYGQTSQRVRRRLAGRLAPALRRESEWQTSLIEQASDGIFVADLTGRYTYVNSAGCRLLGYARDELIGKTILDLIPPEERPSLDASKRDMARGEVHVAEWHLRRKDGSYAEVEVSAKIFPDGRWQGFVRDIGERKRLERALKQTVDDLNRAQAVAQVGSWRLDVLRNELQWSAEAYRIFGIPPGKPLSYEMFLACVHPDDRAFVDARWTAALRGVPYQIEHCIVVGGEVRWVAELAELQFDSRGAVIGGIGTVQDVTDHKHAQQELAKAHEDAKRLHAELDQVTRASVMISEAVASLASAEMSSVLQTIVLQAQTLTGAKYVALGIGGSAEQPFDAWVYTGMPEKTAAAIGRHPRPVGTLGAVARDGERIRVKDVHAHRTFRGFPPHHPEMTSFMGMPIFFRGAAVGNLYLADKEGASEFSEQDERIISMLAGRVGVAIETATLYQSESLRRLWLQTVIDQMPEGVVLLDEHGRVGSMNLALSKLSCGPTAAQDPYGNPVLLDLRRPDGSRVAPEDFPVLRALRHGETIRAAEFQLCLADGTLVPVLVNAAPVRGDKNRILGATAIVQEITKLKELERLREEWASIIAHDLRQPVAAISIAAALLPKLHEGELSEREAKVIARIKDTSHRLNRMVSELQDASQLEAHRLSVRAERVDVVALLRDVIEQQGDVAKENPFILEAPEALFVHADADRFRQIVENLLSNAAKYGDPRAEVRIRVQAQDAYAVVSVINQGQGIPADQLPMLFSRFWRTPEARKTQTAGLGLGLYIAHGLVTAHGGRMWAGSKPGDTTTFSFTLRRAPVPGKMSG